MPGRYRAAVRWAYLEYTRYWYFLVGIRRAYVSGAGMIEVRIDLDYHVKESVHELGEVRPGFRTLWPLVVVAPDEFNSSVLFRSSMIVITL